VIQLSVSTAGKEPTRGPRAYITAILVPYIEYAEIVYRILYWYFQYSIRS